jgi:hypothetical protein
MGCVWLNRLWVVQRGAKVAGRAAFALVFTRNRKQSKWQFLFEDHQQMIKARFSLEALRFNMMVGIAPSMF